MRDIELLKRGTSDVTFTDRGLFLQAWRAMEGLVDYGLVRSIGVSNFREADIEKLLSFCRIPPALNQVL